MDYIKTLLLNWIDEPNGFCIHRSACRDCLLRPPIVITIQDIWNLFGVDWDLKENKYSIEEAEKNIILRALDETNYNQRQAAKLLGMATITFYRKVVKHGIKHESWRKHVLD